MSQCLALNTSTVRIMGKIENGIDYGLIMDGCMKDKELVIKGGSIGDENAVVKMICHN
ncbi:MAG: hypothetical protein KKE35_02090 [Actinobacteria bacterium]|nr:hypothetical protein [Actinomycetota bacterium]